MQKRMPSFIIWTIKPKTKRICILCRKRWSWPSESLNCANLLYKGLKSLEVVSSKNNHKTWKIWTIIEVFGSRLAVKLEDYYNDGLTKEEEAPVQDHQIHLQQIKKTFVPRNETCYYNEFSIHLIILICQ